MSLTCACKSIDPWRCWSIRYGVPIFEVKNDGGPCECDCHDADDEMSTPESAQTAGDDAGGRADG